MLTLQSCSGSASACSSTSFQPHVREYVSQFLSHWGHIYSPQRFTRRIFGSSTREYLYDSYGMLLMDDSQPNCTDSKVLTCRLFVSLRAMMRDFAVLTLLAVRKPELYLSTKTDPTSRYGASLASCYLWCG